MKEIGEKLKNAREDIGISLEEAAEDLKVNIQELENIELGNMEAFQDIMYLKYFIRDYAKYLGLNKEELVDEFNEYLFDYTSKLSLDDIKRETKERKEEKNNIRSPYTMERKSDRMLQYATYVSIFLLIIIIGYLLFTLFYDKDVPNEQPIVAVGGSYEFSEQINNV